MIWSLIPDWLPLILGGAVAAIAAFLGGRWSGVKQGQSQANSEGMKDDYENADDIRRRVSLDRSQRMRELDDAGFRD